MCPTGSVTTAGELSQCPLLEELQAIEKLNSNSVVLIDDARLFLAPPLAPHEISQWPSLHQIVTCLLLLSSEHELMVVNDVIAFYPLTARPALESYARSCGIDWLTATNCLKENGSFMLQLEEKENVIQQKELAIQEMASVVQEKENAIRQMDSVIQEKERVINVQVRAIKAYRLAVWPFLPLWRVFTTAARRCVEIVRPRLGNLNQYAPRPLSVGGRKMPNTRLTGQHLKVSIVTPSFGQGAYIEETLLSVLDQQYPNLEYFVQDGASKDSTVDVLKNHEAKLTGWTSEKDSGQSQAINRGFAKTSGEIMAWLNSDDLLLPGALTIAADYFNRHPEVDVLYGNRLLIDANGMEIGRWIMPGHNSAVLSWVDYVPQETMFWRRRIWDKVGGQIDESFRFAMDWDLLVRFRDAGAKFAHIPQFMGAFRIHEHQKTSAAINDVGHQEMDRIRARVFGRVPNHKEIRKAALPYLLKHVAVDMLYRIKTRLGVHS